LVFLVGCHHDKAQTYSADSKLNDPQNQTQREFRKLLLDTIEKYKPSLIAEEHHLESLKAKKLCSVAHEVALEMRISHRFCNPSRAEREKLDISRGKPIWANGTPENHREWCEYFGKQWPIREIFWVNKLGTYINDRVLFICGAVHRCTFRRQVESKGIAVKVVKEKIGSSCRMFKSVSEYEAYKCVRRNGFPSGNKCKTCMQRSTGYT
jgi:hypothetical protein